MASLRLLVAGAALWALGVQAEYPCESEIASACPDSPKSEVAACLKDSAQHENPTEVSSQCTDFMALNTACAEELVTLCEEEFYSHETTPCLTKYNTEEEEGSVSDKCKSVMKWALPSDEEVPEEAEKVTDELGMTEQDRQEKEEWRAKRKAGREAAMDRMKQKEVDKKKEDERMALEKFKEEDPEGYKTMISQQEEEKKQQREQKKRERLLQAAMERKKREAAGSDDEDAAAAKRPKKGKKQAAGSWAGLLFKVLAGAGFVGLGYAVYSGMAKGSGGGGGGRTSGKGKKKRG